MYKNPGGGGHGPTCGDACSDHDTMGWHSLTKDMHEKHNFLLEWQL